MNRWRKKSAEGDVVVVRYADDIVLEFEPRREGEAFLEQLREWMRRFGLERRPEKTRLIEFGRFAEDNRRRRGEGKPATFNFLGFTHSCGTTRKGGLFTVKRRTITERLRSKQREIKQELQGRLHERTVDTGKWLGRVVQGYFHYYAVPGNTRLPAATQHG